jgi:hypothetical protein
MYHPGRSAHRPRAAGTGTDAQQRRAASGVHSELGKGRNAKAIHQDLVEHHGYTGSYDAVKRLARSLRRGAPKVGCRFETEPGQEAQGRLRRGRADARPRFGQIPPSAAVRHDPGQQPPYVSESGLEVVNGDLVPPA